MVNKHTSQFHFKGSSQAGRQSKSLAGVPAGSAVVFLAASIWKKES